MKSIIAFASLALLAAIVPACEESTPSSPSPDGVTPPVDAGGPAVVSCPPPTAGPTVHETADAEENEVWTAAGSPHIVNVDVRVKDGHKLTIEPCAEVLLAKGKHLQVAFPGTPNTGTLVAEGTAEKPIRIAAKDAEPWASLYVSAPGTARLAYVTLEGGGGGDFEDGSTIDILGDGVLPADPALFVDHVTVKGSRGAGVWMQRGAAFLPGSKDLTVTGSGGFPLQADEHAIDALPTGTFTGNAADEILLRTYGFGEAGGGLAVDATLHERGVPYHMGLTQQEDFIVGGPAGKPAATLTIEPGVVLRFQKETGLRVQTGTSSEPAHGAIRALGTAEKPIVFTSASATPTAGDWRGIWFGGIPLATNKLDHVRIEYAGHDCGCTLNTCSIDTTSEGALVFTGKPPSGLLTNSRIAHSGGHGITQGYDGEFVDLRATNTFEGIARCVQTYPRQTGGSCPTPQPACDE